MEQKELIELCCHLTRTLENEKLKEKLNELDDINMLNKYGNHLAFIAAWNKNIEILELLINNKDVEIPSVVSLAGARHLDVLHYLDSKNLLDVTAKDENGFTPLQQAINLRNPSCPFGSLEVDLVDERYDCVEFLLENGANVDDQNDFGRTAIMGAANINWHDMVELLIEFGASTNIICKDGKKAEDYASNEELKTIIRRSNFKVVK